MITALLLLTQARTVTFSHPCARAEVVLSALGKELGEKLASGEMLSNDYFTVKFTMRPVDDVKRVIAETLNASWSMKGEHLVLDRRPEQLKSERAMEDEELRAGLEKFKAENPVRDFSLEILRQRLVEAASSNSLEAFSQLQEAKPSKLFQSDLVHGFEADLLLSIEDGATQRYYYNLDGRSDLPQGPRDAVKSYIERLQTAFTDARRHGTESYFGSDGSPLSIGRCDYVLTVSKRDGHLEFVLQQTPAESGQSQQLGSIRFSVFKNYNVPGGKKPSLPKFVGGLPLDVFQESMISVLSKPSYTPVEDRPSEAALTTALVLAKDLVANEPLAVFGCAPLNAIAEAANKDFVALVPDGTAFDGPWMNYVSTNDLNVIWSLWLQRMYLREDEATGIMKVFPRYPRFERENRYDRAAISRYINAYLRVGFHNLDAVSDLAKASNDDQIMARQSEIASRFLGTPNGTYFVHWIAYRAYGELSPQERQRARLEGFVLSWPALSDVVRAASEHVLLSPLARFGDSVPPPSTTIDNRNTVVSGEMMGVLSRLTQVPKGTRVEFRVGVGELLRPQTERLDFASFAPNLFTAEGFAGFRKSGGFHGNFNFERAAVTTIERLHVAFSVPEAGVHYLAAQLDSGSKNTKYVPLNELPEPWRTRLLDAIKKSGGELN